MKALLYKNLGVTQEDVLKANINKLKKRYPLKFSNDDALHRDLTTERKSLEDDLERPTPRSEGREIL